MSELDEFFGSVGTNKRAGRNASGGIAKSHDGYEASSPVGHNPGIVVNSDSAEGESRWSEGDGFFWRAKKTHAILPAGLYNCVYLEGVGSALRKQELKTDDLLVLPEKNSKKIIHEFEKFWTLEEQFKLFGFLYKRGFLLWGPAGCHAKGTRVIMYDGTTKAVEDVRVGDLLMGPDSCPRKVLELRRGRDKMYRVTPTKGEPFIVNQNHILSLHPSGTGHAMRDRFNISVNSFLNQSHDWQKRSKLYRSNLIEWPKSSHKLPIPPYILGAWLGDGHSHTASLTNMDQEIIHEWTQWLKSTGCDIHEYHKTSSKANTYAGVLPEGYDRIGKLKGAIHNKANQLLKDINVLCNKHIPHEYLTASRQERLELVAGLMDTDGHNAGGYYDFISKSRQLAYDVVFLCRSLGLAAYVVTAEKGCTYRGKHKIGQFWRVSISGNMHDVPCKLFRKQLAERKQIKNVLVTGFDLEELDVDDYYGFILNDDHLYLLDDFTVTHNSGKTSILNLMMKTIIEQHNGIIITVEDSDLASNCLAMVRKNEPNRPLLTILEDIDALIERYGEAGYLNLLDGSEQINNVIHIASCNYPERLDRRFVDRPSRFDTVVKIGMPGWDARETYFKFKFADKNIAWWNDKELERWTKLSQGLSIAHLREMIIAVCCFHQDIEEVTRRLVASHERLPTSDDSDGPPIGFIQGS